MNDNALNVPSMGTLHVPLLAAYSADNLLHYGG